MIETKISQTLQPYPTTIKWMEQYVSSIINQDFPQLLWYLEHDHVFTCGSSAKDGEVLQKVAPVIHTGRGGRVTYHGPGQRVVYLMLDLNNYGRDLRKYINMLEQWLIMSLQELGLQAFTNRQRVGIWVNNNGQEQKIAAIGVRVKKWVTYHGVALNINPDLSYFDHIIPCGLQEFKATSLKELGINCTLEEMDLILQRNFIKIFEFRESLCRCYSSY